MSDVQVHTDPTDRLVGQVVAGRFRILAQRYAGPHSRVYEVEPPSVGHARRALKLRCTPEAREPAASDRLGTLAEVARGLDSPHVEEIFGCGRLPDDTPYLLTEWLALPTLAEWLDAERGINLGRALQVIRAVAAGLGALHSRGLVHGDVRPEHILVEPGVGQFERVVLIDAGLDAALDLPPARNLTGTLAHRAPERLRGGPATPAADVYALGVLAWHLIAGRLPFTADDLRAAKTSADPAERVQWLHLNAKPRRPSSLPSVEADARVESVIGRSLAKAPGQRPADGDAFLDLLDELLAQSTTPAVGPWFAEAPSETTDPSFPSLGPLQVRAPEPERIPPVGLVPWVGAGFAVGVFGALFTHFI